MCFSSYITFGRSATAAEIPLLVLLAVVEATFACCKDCEQQKRISEEPHLSRGIGVEVKGVAGRDTIVAQ